MNTEIIADEREGLPSASGYERMVLCVGSRQQEAQAPESKDTKDSTKGDRIHAFLAAKYSKAKDCPLLDQEEQGVANRCVTQIDALLATLHDPQLIVEERLWFRRDGQKLFSGQPDIIAIDFAGAGPTAMIIDTKSGRGEVATSDENYQLRALAISLKNNRPDLTCIEGAIVQPLTGKPKIVRYGEAELDRALVEFYAADAASKQPNGKLTAGVMQCKYCRALSFCTEAGKSVTTLAKTTAGPLGLAKLDDATLAQLHGQAKLAEKVVKEVKDEMKRRVTAKRELTVGGRTYYIANGGNNKDVKDPIAAMVAMRGLMTDSDYATACAVSIPKLAEIVQTKQGVSEDKAKELVEGALATLIQLTPRAGSLRDRKAA